MIRVGMIGCGGIGGAHGRSIGDAVPGVKIVAAADLSREARERYGKEFDVPRLFESYEAMFAEAELDAVCVALPTALHRAATVAAAKAGLHVMCEKPMAMSVRDCDVMINACEKAGVKLMIAHCRRYDNFWGKLKEIMDSGAIGRPVLWRHVACGGPKQQWFLDAEIGGGPYVDGCVHNYEFANYMFGTPVEALGSLMTLHPSTALDTGAMVVRYEGGDEILLAWSWATRKSHSGGTTMDILGPEGVILFPGHFPESEYPKSFNHEKQGAFLVKTDGRKKLVRYRKNQMIADEWKDFRDAIREDRPPLATPQEARLAVAVARAVLKAGATHRPVKIRV